MAWNARRSVVHNCSLFSPPDDSWSASALRKCSIASLCAPMFKPNIFRPNQQTSEMKGIQETRSNGKWATLTGYANIVDGTSVRRPKL